MKTIRSGIQSLLSFVLLATLFLSMLPTPVSAAYELRLYTSSGSNTTTTSSKIRVYENNGTLYAPLRDTVKKLGYSFSGSIEDELFTYHKYTVTHNGKAAIFWGSHDMGYQIETYTVSKGSGPNNNKVYEPPMQCQQESDICQLITSKYTGPIVYDGTLYVPVRQLAEALSLKLNISKDSGKSVVSLTASISTSM
ncbi:hypothetical protein ACE3MZ_12035 [Paenibacillus sp. WLX1005]|uniref:hypothetical protein n=1 Tax=Paenibacillus sp. WLX1005 TaxID=3243766 RepID=UPI003983E3B1